MKSARIMSLFFVGLSFGVALTLLALAFVTSPSEYNVFLNHYQTLIAGGLAFVGAILAWRSLVEQISLTEQIQEDNRLRQDAAARAALAVPLDEIFQWQELCIKELVPIYKGPGSILLPGHNIFFKLPEFPSEYIRYFTECIATADRQYANALSEAVVLIQIQQARTKECFAELRVGGYVWGNSEQLRPKIEQFLFDAILAYVRLGNLFFYVRRQDDQFVGTWTIDQIASATKNFSLPSELGDLLLKRAKMYDEKP